MRRLLSGLAAVIGLVLFLPSVASAHVSVDGDGAAQGGYAVLTFKVPNERDDASTTKLDVQLPTDTPLASVSVKPLPGWTAQVKTTTLDEPVEVHDKLEVPAEGIVREMEEIDGEVHGKPVTEVASEIIWTGGQIKPGEFQEFEVSTGPLPEVDSMTFPTIQTYDGGEEVAWIEKPSADGEDPERPAPVLELAAAADDGHGSDAGTEATEAAGSDTVAPISADVATKDDVDSASTKGTIGLVLGALGLVAGAAALAVTLKKRSTV